MSQLEEAVNVHLGQRALEKKRPESVRVEAAARADSEGTGVAKTFP